MHGLLHGIKKFIKQKATILKLLFVFSVMIFVIYEVGRIFKQVDWQIVGDNLSEQSFGVIFLLLVLGMLAVCPMLLYDFVIVKFLPGKYSLGYILRSGWIVNTFTNLAGFGGILGATLRANFYNKDASKKQVLYALSKIALFLLSGLSLFCWLCLALMLTTNIDTTYQNYYVWLLGGGIYFPILFLVTKFKGNEFFKDLTIKRELTLILASVLEWGFAGGFFLLIGAFLGFKINLLAVFPLYIIASVLGIISMVPGGLGSFDVLMLLELTSLGVSNEQAVVWLLFFRLFYYIVPFIIGGIFFVHSAGHGINQKFDGIPKSILQKCSHILVTAFMYFSGIFMLLEAAVPNFTYNNQILLKIMPYTFFFLDHITTIIFAFLLIGMARGIESKLKKAYIPTLVVLAIGIINTLWKAYTLSLAVFLALVMLMVYFSRHEMYRQRLQYSFGKLVVDAAIFVGTFVLYAIVGIINFPAKHIPNHFKKIPDFLLFPGQKLWFYGLLGLLLAAVILLLVLKYFTQGVDPFKRQTFDAKRIKAVIEQYGGSEVSHLAFLRDKNTYFYRVDEEDKLFFMYKKMADKLIIMGGPIGDQQYLRPALEQFMQEADVYGYRLVFYEISGPLTMLLHEYGFDFIKTGEEGYLTLADFTLTGKKRRAQRALMNKFEREGYVFSIENPPFSSEFMEQLREVSDSWLNGQVEKGFSLGFFDEFYLNQAPIAIIKDEQEKIVAFASLMPMKDNILSIDLMRESKDAPSGIMDKIFISLFEYGREQGYEYFDMGMAPLANVGDSEFSFIEERMAHFIYEYGYNLYGFQGLKAYKNKYVTEWQPRYTAYRKPSSVAITMLQLVIVVNQKRHDHNRYDPNLLVPDFLQK